MADLEKFKKVKGALLKEYKRAQMEGVDIQIDSDEEGHFLVVDLTYVQRRRDLPCGSEIRDGVRIYHRSKGIKPL